LYSVCIFGKEGYMHPLMQFQGEPVEITTRDGGIHRGVIAGGDPPRGIIYYFFFW
jgi:hypothetical protein